MMSLNALTRDLPRRRPSGGTAFGLPAAPAPAAPQPEDGNATQLLDSLTKFVPTELLAPYLTALSLAAPQKWNAITIYKWFIVATPPAVFLFEFAKAALDKRDWPALRILIWRALAAALAFAVWALSAPTNPLQAAVGGAAVVGFAAMIISPVLTGIDAIVLRVLGPKS